MPARPEGGARQQPSEVLQVPPSASRQQVEEAYLHCLARLRSAFLDLGGFDSLPASQSLHFDNFVTGTASDVAKSACERVCDNDRVDFNPLYLYGRPGLGKTHLLTSIFNRLSDRQPQLLVVSTTAEHFTEELLQAVGNHRMTQFRDKYRSVDVLLMDGFHMLASRHRTQEELCGVLDHLTSSGRKVVVASQSSPRDTDGLLESLRSRLSSGLVVEIGYPDLETRKAIVRQLSEQAGLGLTRDVVFTLANRIQHDVRELKGAVSRLLAHGRALGDGTRLALDELLYDLAPTPRSERCTLDEVIEHVTAFYDIPLEQLTTKPITKQVKKARQIAMYLARQLTAESLHNVADALGATPNQVLYAVRVTKENLDDPTVSRDLEAVRAHLRGESKPAEPPRRNPRRR